MGSDIVLSVIRKYVDECLKEPQRHLLRGCFEQRSYQRWAVDELMKEIRDAKSMPPIMVVEKFVQKMDDFSCSSHKNSIIFSIAHDMATDILDRLLIMK